MIGDTPAAHDAGPELPSGSTGADVPSDQFAAGSIANVAMKSMFWSLVQNWGGRMMNFVQFVILAKFLAPQDFGLAASAAIITLLISLVAELGFSDAIIQRPGLEPADVNLPFFVSIGVSSALAGTAVLLSHRIEVWMEVAGLARVVTALALTNPISTFSLFQESMYKRHLNFRGLAFRIMLANLIATCVSVPCAIMGFGVWSLVIQTYLVILIGAVWLWSKPLWVPSLVMRPRAFLRLARFGVSVLAMRLLDFGTTRFVEVITIGRFGVAQYGFYTASSKLNQTLMDLLQSALNDVSLTLLSKISGSVERLAAVYRTTIAIAGNLVPPVFVLVAVLSPEICGVLFDRRWAGIDRIAMPLFLLGAVQALQFFSRPYLKSRGRSEMVLVISVIKFAFVVTTLVLAPRTTLQDLIFWFVVAQLGSAPFSFGITAREIRVPIWQIYIDIAPVVASCAAAFFAVRATRPWVLIHIAAASFSVGVTLALVYAIVYTSVILLIGRRQLGTLAQFAMTRIRARRGA